MKKKYNQPEVVLAQYAPMTLMQAASPAGENMGMFDTGTGSQW